MDLKEITEEVKKAFPGVERVEAEGPLIVAYVRDVGAVPPEAIRALAVRIKKRISVRASQKTSPEEAKTLLLSLLPKEAGVREVFFAPDFDEMIIEAKKPGLLVGKYGDVLRQVFLRTGWIPKVERLPPLPSVTVFGIRRLHAKFSERRRKFLVELGKRVNVDRRPSWVRGVALGGFGEVGRSCLLLETDHSRILVDCGINNASFDPLKSFPMLNAERLSPEFIDAVIISHAHADHCGFLPYLFSLGYDGPVFATPPTRDLMALIQQDYLNVLEKNGVEEAPYSISDIQKELLHVITVGYHEVIDVSPDVKLAFYNAGHILGSAMVHLNIGNGFHNVLYSGDVKYGFARLFDEAETRFPRVETMFLEATYGGDRDFQPRREEAEKKLIDLVEEVVKNRGTVLIPVFAIGRAQEVMLTFYERYQEEGPPFPIYLDGMVLEVSAIHSAYPEYLRRSLRSRILGGEKIFDWEGFKNARGKSKEEVASEPGVILAPSGMLQGGPSVEYLKLLAEDERNAVVFVGYQAPNTLGARIKGGEREIQLFGAQGSEVLRISLRVETVEGFSGHSDRRQLLSLIRNMRPKPSRIITMHGSGEKPGQLARALRRMRIKASAMQNLEAVRFR